MVRPFSSCTELIFNVSPRQYLNSDNPNIGYPMTTNLLILVEAEVDTEAWFPFTLVLNHDLKVILRGKWGYLRKLFKGNATTQWSFSIAGNYDPDMASTALEHAMRNELDQARPPPGLGLKAALKNWGSEPVSQWKYKIPTWLLWNM